MKWSVYRVCAGLALSLLCVASAQEQSEIALRGVVIPTGFQGTKYSAMIQIAVDGSPLPDATWDLDATLVPEGRASTGFSGQVTAVEPGTPVVLEGQVEFHPGSYRLSLTARETTAGQSGTQELRGFWPDPDYEPATVSPIALLQPVQGSFKRGESVRSRGALALEDEDPVRVQLPTAAISVVCRGPSLKGAMRVERKLEGTSAVDFEPIVLPPDGDRCAQVRDIIPPAALGPGSFRYVVHLMTDSVEVAAGVRAFDAVASVPETPPGS